MKTRPREELQSLLENVLGSSNVYFQPPSNFKLKYPCIVYNRNVIRPVHADNINYLKRMRYTLTHISKDPDDSVIEELDDIPYCSHTRNYIADNLNHDVYDIYW